MTGRTLLRGAAFAVALALPCSAFATTITIVNVDAAGVGFNDPTPRTPVGGNSGTTLGEQRMNAFKHAATYWAERIDSPVEIFVRASFEAKPCSSTSAVLGSAGTRFIFTDFDRSAAGKHLVLGRPRQQARGRGRRSPLRIRRVSCV